MRKLRKNASLLLIAVLVCSGLWASKGYAQGPYEGTMLSSTQYLDLPPDGSRSDVATIRVRNDGTETWYNTGTNAVAISYRAEPGDSGDNGNTDSHFGCADWDSAYKVGTMNETSVAPGDTATFDFWMCNENSEASSAGYDWTEHFAVAYGGSWMSDGAGDVPKFTARIKVLRDWEADTPSPSEVNVDIPETGETTVTTIRVRNDGAQTWYNSGSNAVSINYRYEPGDSGTNSNLDSKFYCADWVNNHRISYMNETAVAPGNSATFDIWFCNPTGEASSTGYNWQEHFAIGYGDTWIPTASTDAAKVLAYFQVTAVEQWEGGPPTPDPVYIAIPENGTSDVVVVSVQNTGDTTWSNSGTDAVAISYRYEPGDAGSNSNQDSKFYCADWINNHTISTMNEASVASGEDATFDLWFCNPTGEAPSAGYDWQEHFAVGHGTAWISATGGNDVAKMVAHFKVTAQQPTEHWEASGPTPAQPQIDVPQDGTASVTTTLSVQNTGTTTWTDTGTDAVSLNYRWETGDAGDDSNTNSHFGCPNWVNASRVSYINEASVAPSETATVDLWLCNENREAPSAGYDWQEHYALAYGGTWMPDGAGDVSKALASLRVVTDTRYEAKWISQTKDFKLDSENIVNVGPNEKRILEVTFQNTGSEAWEVGEVVLAVRKPSDSPTLCPANSDFPGSSIWRDNSEDDFGTEPDLPEGIDHWKNWGWFGDAESQASKNTERVPVGESYTFRLSIFANPEQGIDEDTLCDEHFSLAYQEASGVWQWMDGHTDTASPDGIANVWWRIKDPYVQSQGFSTGQCDYLPGTSVDPLLKYTADAPRTIDKLRFTLTNAEGSNATFQPLEIKVDFYNAQTDQWTTKVLNVEPESIPVSELFIRDFEIERTSATMVQVTVSIPSYHDLIFQGWQDPPITCDFVQGVKFLKWEEDRTPPKPALSGRLALYLPFRNRKYVSQGWYGSFSHSRIPAIDFAGSFEVLTSHDGYIRRIKEDVSGPTGRCSDSNYVTVEDKYQPGLYTHYVHLVRNSVPDDLWVGKEVHAGDLIGISGNTGCSYGDHLHFNVSTSEYWNSNYSDNYYFVEYPNRNWRYLGYVTSQNNPIPFKATWVAQQNGPDQQNHTSVYTEKSRPTVVSVKFRNSGWRTWEKGQTGDKNVGLYVRHFDPGQPYSYFQCDSWETPYRVASFKEVSVAPGEVATFEFELCGSSELTPEHYKVGNGTDIEPEFGYTERFWLATGDGQEFMSGDGVWYPITLTPFQGEWVSQSHKGETSVEISKYGSTTVWVDVKNTGIRTWTKVGEDEVSVFTKQNLQLPSFSCTGDGFVAPLSKKVDQNGNILDENPTQIAPGEIARFEFPLCAKEDYMEIGKDDYTQNLGFGNRSATWGHDWLLASDKGDEHEQVAAWFLIKVRDTTDRDRLLYTFKDFKDAVKLSIETDVSAFSDLQAKYIIALRNDWKDYLEAIWTIQSGGIPDPSDQVKLGKDMQLLSKFSNAIGTVDTATTVAIEMAELSSDISDFDTELAMKNKIFSHFMDNVKFTPTSGGTYTGITDYLEEIEEQYQSYITQIPDPLPPDYPVESVITFLRQQTAALKASTDKETYVYIYHPTVCESAKLGVLQAQKDAMHSMAGKLDFVENVSFAATITEMGAVLGGPCLKVAGIIGTPVTLGGSTVILIPSEAVFWGGIANIKLLSSLIGGLSDIGGLSIQGVMSKVVYEAITQLSTDLALRRTVFQHTGDWVTTADAMNAKHLTQLPDQNSIQIKSISVPNVIVPENETSGQGVGQILIENISHISVNVGIYGSITSQLGQNISTVGLLGAAPVPITPGVQQSITFTYTLLRSSLLHYTGYDVHLFITAASSEGVDIQGPLVTHVFAGTDPQVSVFSKQDVAPVISGTLEARQVITKSVRFTSTTHSGRLLLSFAEGADYDLHLYDTNGNHVGVDHDTGEIENQISDTIYSSYTSWPEWIIVQNPGGQEYQVTIVARDSKAGKGFTLSKLETPSLSAILDTPAHITWSIARTAKISPTVESFGLQIAEGSGSQPISDLQVSSTDFRSEEGHIVSASQILCEASTEITSGTSILAECTSTITPETPPDTYKGTLQVRGEDMIGTVLTSTTQVTLDVSEPKWRIYLPVVMKKKLGL